MNTIKNPVVFEQIINKSKFITYLSPAPTEEEAKAYLESIKTKHFDATHNCYSYIIGSTANIMKYHDDGEPTGTAGVVIYEVLRKNNLTNIIAIVTRYYGGIKLGAGGLIRAYSSATKYAVEAAIIEKIITYIQIKLICDYQDLNNVEKRIENYEILDKAFEEKITIKIKLPEDDFLSLENDLIDITKNQISIKAL